jgi:hypothetical protein
MVKICFHWDVGLLHKVILLEEYGSQIIRSMDLVSIHFVKLNLWNV